MAIPEDLLKPDVIGPLVVTPTFFMSVLAGIALVMWFRAKSERRRQEMLKFLVEKGQPVPAGLLGPARKPPTSDLRRGLVMLGAGVGIGSALLAAHQAETAGLGLIPACIGLGYLLTWKLEAKGRAAGGLEG